MLNTEELGGVVIVSCDVVEPSYRSQVMIEGVKERRV